MTHVCLLNLSKAFKNNLNMNKIKHSILEATAFTFTLTLAVGSISAD